MTDVKVVFIDDTDQTFNCSYNHVRDGVLSMAFPLSDGKYKQKFIPLHQIKYIDTTDLKEDVDKRKKRKDSNGNDQS